MFRFLFRLPAIFLVVLVLSGSEVVEIFSFSDFEANATGEWISVNDGVMGGISEGTYSFTGSGTLLFSGRLSLENNGGFASIRSRIPTGLSRSLGGILVRVRGDGRGYWLDLRTSREGSAGSYRAPLPTTGREGFEDIFVPISDFRLSRFGRTIAGRPLNPKEIRSVGFTLSDYREGPFALEIESIQAVMRDSPDPTLTRSPAALIILAIERGVPLFNEGNPAACRAVYELTCEALLLLPDLPETSKRDLSQALLSMRESDNEAERAWILRYALDGVLEAVSIERPEAAE